MQQQQQHHHQQQRRPRDTQTLLAASIDLRRDKSSSHHTLQVSRERYPRLRSDRHNISGSSTADIKQLDSNLIPISLCASSMFAVGSLMLAAGLVVMIFDRLEMGPPHYDELFERYEGSSLGGIVGELAVPTRPRPRPHPLWRSIATDLPRH